MKLCYNITQVATYKFLDMETQPFMKKVDN